MVFPYENVDNYTIKDLLQGRNAEKIAVIIGPEGGFSDTEAETLNEMSIKGVSLGKTILRTETAGLATISMIMYELEL